VLQKVLSCDTSSILEVKGRLRIWLGFRSLTGKKGIIKKDAIVPKKDRTHKTRSKNYWNIL